MTKNHAIAGILYSMKEIKYFQSRINRYLLLAGGKFIVPYAYANAVNFFTAEILTEEKKIDEYLKELSLCHY